jgi:Mycothiol maleylpyruvate isomerase N-terminal domain
MVANKIQTKNVEGKAMIGALQQLPGDAPTACVGWTAHHVAAHLAAGSKEVADLIEAKLEGHPNRPTRGFEEREAPFRAMPHDEVIGRLVAESKRKLSAYDALASTPDDTIAFTGTTLDIERLATHSRSEAAIHRWDMTGSDDTSRELLSQPELTAHSVWVLNAMPVLQESTKALGARAAAKGYTNHVIAFRTEDRPDVVLHAAPPMAWMEMNASPGEVDVVVLLSAEHRLLTLWGRRPSEVDWVVEGDPDLAASLDDIVRPNAIPWPQV